MGTMRKVRGMLRADAIGAGAGAAPGGDFRETIEAALRRRVGTGRPWSAGDVAAAIGRGQRTVESWIYGEAVPRGGELAALIGFFGADFANEVLGATGKVVIDRAVLERLPEVAAALRSLSALSALLRELDG